MARRRSLADVHFNEVSEALETRRRHVVALMIPRQTACSVYSYMVTIVHAAALAAMVVSHA